METVHCTLVFEGGSKVDVQGDGETWAEAWDDAKESAGRWCSTRKACGNLAENNGDGAKAFIDSDGYCKDTR